MKGLISSNASSLPPFEPSTLPKHREWADSSMHGFQLFISKYMLDGYARSYIFDKK
jgi:hypothetical protein